MSVVSDGQTMADRPSFVVLRSVNKTPSIASCTCDALVQYDYGVVIDAEKLTLRDRLILHALGVSWATNQRRGPARVP